MLAGLTNWFVGSWLCNLYACTASSAMIPSLPSRSFHRNTDLINFPTYVCEGNGGRVTWAGKRVLSVWFFHDVVFPSNTIMSNVLNQKGVFIKDYKEMTGHRRIFLHKIKTVQMDNVTSTFSFCVKLNM